MQDMIRMKEPGREVPYVLPLQEKKFHWNLNFAILPMANLLNLYSAYCYILEISQ